MNRLSLTHYTLQLFPVGFRPYYMLEAVRSKTRYISQVSSKGILTTVASSYVFSQFRIYHHWLMIFWLYKGICSDGFSSNTQFMETRSASCQNTPSLLLWVHEARIYHPNQPIARRRRYGWWCWPRSIRFPSSLTENPGAVASEGYTFKKRYPLSMQPV